MVLMLPSYSAITVFDIRFSAPRETESNQQHVTRLAQTYGIGELDVRVMIAADDDHIDAFGRIAERAS